MIAFLLAAFLCATEPGDVIGQSLQASFIWSPSAPAGTQAYVAFRKTFTLDALPESAALSIFADSRYILWVNGDYKERGPCRFDPKAPSYDVLDVRAKLRQGTNSIVVLVHHYHDGLAADDPTALNGRTMRHVPGLAARLDITDGRGAVTTVKTDSTWRCSGKTRFRPSPVAWGWIPDDIDARLDSGDWTQTGFDDAAWELPVPVDGNQWGALVPRPIALLREERITPAALVAAPDSGKTKSLPVPLASALPLSLQTGEEILLDVGRSVLAYDVIDLEAAAGSSIEVTHGHGFSSGKLDEVYGSNRYIAKDGRQEYVSGDTAGFRYMTVKALSGPIVLDSISVVNRCYPFDVSGSFESSDPFLNELWTRSILTVGLCCEDGYTDCTARERTEWLGDAAIIEYPFTRVAFTTGAERGNRRYGDAALVANMLDHIAMSQQPDGRLKAHHPSNRWDIHGYIEDYACLWVRALRQYYDNTFDDALVRKVWPALVRQMAWFLEHRTGNGLVKARDFVFPDNPLAYKVYESTTLNAIVASAFSNAAYLANVLGDSAARDSYGEAGEALAKRINELLWNDAEGTYDAGLMEGVRAAPTAHAAMLALYADVVPRERRERTRQWFAAHLAQVGSPFSHHYLFDVLYRADDPVFDLAALKTMRSRWASTMARRDLDTVFEGFGGPSLCHNAGASPACYLAMYVLGVRREGPVSERTITIDPRPGDLEYARGSVVTELGIVDIDWKRAGGMFSLNVKIPESTTGVVRVPASGKNAVSVDGKPVSDLPENTFLGEERGHVVLRLSGNRSIQARQ